MEGVKNNVVKVSILKLKLWSPAKFVNRTCAPLPPPKKKWQQAGAELGQAQLKLGLDLIFIWCKFGSSRFGLVELVEYI